MSFVGSYVREHLKAQSAVVPVLKHLRRGGHGYKSFPKHAGRAWNQTQDYITGARSYCKINSVKLFSNKTHEATFKLVLTLILSCCYKSLNCNGYFLNAEKHFY